MKASKGQGEQNLEAGSVVGRGLATLWLRRRRHRLPAGSPSRGLQGGGWEGPVGGGV